MKNVSTASEFIQFCESVSITEVAKISPKITNLQVSLYISPETKNKHIPRLKVSNTRGVSFDVDNNFSIAISDDPIILAGSCELSTQDLLDVKTWIIMNRQILTKYWFSDYDDVYTDIFTKLKSVGIKQTGVGHE